MTGNDVIGQEIADGKVLSLVDGHRANYYVGLDASKSVSPGVGDAYLAYDTGKNYICFVAGIWSLSYSPCVEEYTNHLGTTDNILTTVVTGTGSAITDTTNHEMDLSTGIGAGSAKYIIDRGISPGIGVNFDFNCIVNNIVKGVGTTSVFQIGLLHVSRGALFMQNDDAGWYCYTFKTSSHEQTNIDDILSGDILTIKNCGDHILYMVNGIMVASHTGYSSALAGFMTVYVSGGSMTTAKSISVDYIGVQKYK